MAAPQPPPKRTPSIPRRDSDGASSEHRSASEKVYSPDFSENFHRPYSSDSSARGTSDSSTRGASNPSSAPSAPPLRTTNPQAPPSIHRKQFGHTHQHGAHYLSHTDPYDIFKKFFGTQDFRQAASMGDGFSFFDNPSVTPSQRNSQDDECPLPYSSSSQKQEEEPVELIVDPPIVRNYFCSLEDMYFLWR